MKNKSSKSSQTEEINKDVLKDEKGETITVGYGIRFGDGPIKTGKIKLPVVPFENKRHMKLSNPTPNPTPQSERREK